MFRTISQTRHRTIASSRSSAGTRRQVHGGDRLPWVTGTATATTISTPLTSLDWQVHVYGDARPETDLPLHVFPWSQEAERAGLQRDAAYLIRPDGYVAVAGWSK